MDNMVHSEEMAGSFNAIIIKKIFDFVASLMLCVILLPMFIVVSIIILAITGRPIFYPWDVIGKNGKSFRGYKFRTMVKNADQIKSELQSNNEMKGPVFKMQKDPRVTNLGKILRKYSIDELPQLWSVLKGDMSLVGPRPAGPHEWERYEEWQKRKLCVIPGITCIWQVNGRNEINDFDEWVKMDLEYIDNWSLWLDCKILLKTIPAVLKGTGF